MLTLLLTVALVGFVVWLIVTYIPMPDVFRTVFLALAALLLILYVANALGFTDVALPRR